MSAITSTVIPYYVLAAPSEAVASIISANPSQTAMLINCLPGTDGNDCGYYDLSVTVGPWAAATPPAKLPATGRFDMYMTIPGSEEGEDGATDSSAAGDPGFTFSIGCDMTSTTVPAVCTSINIGGNNDGTETATFTNPGTDFAFSLATLTLTAGVEKLAAAAAATATAGTSSQTGASVTSTSVQSAGTTTGSTAAGATPTGPAGTHGVQMGTLGLLAMIAAFFTG